MLQGGLVSLSGLHASPLSYSFRVWLRSRKEIGAHPLTNKPFNKTRNLAKHFI